jgi:sensor histidine kinase YesM
MHTEQPHQIAVEETEDRRQRQKTQCKRPETMQEREKTRDKRQETRDKPSEIKDESSGIGLANVRRRLELLYPDQHELKIDEKEDSYLVELTIKHI